MHYERIKEVKMYYWRCLECQEPGEAEKEPPIQSKCYACGEENLDLESDYFNE